MLYASITTISQMKEFSITIMSIMCALSVVLVVISYKELKSDKQ